MAIPTFVANGVIRAGTGAVTPSYPTSLEDDILILHIVGDDAVEAADSQGDFGGELIGSIGAHGASASWCRVTAYWKRVPATPPTGNASIPDAGDGIIAVISAWRGCRTDASPIEPHVGLSKDTVTNTTINFPSITTTVDECLILLMHACGDNSLTVRSQVGNLDGSLSERYDSTTTSGSDYGTALYTSGMTKAGPTAGPDTVITAVQASSEQEANISIGLMPAAPTHPTFAGRGDIEFSVATIFPTYPADLAQDDILLLHIQSDGDGDDVADPQGDFGGTLVGFVTSGGSTGLNTRNTVYWKRTGGVELINFVTIADLGNIAHAAITAWRGCVRVGSPIDLFATRADATADVNVEFAPVTTSADQALALLFHCAGDDSLTTSYTQQNLDYVEELYDSTTVQGTDYEISLAYGPKATAGAIGTITATQDQVELEANLTVILKAFVEVPVNPIVLSVEKFSIAMPNGTVSTPALSLSQNLNNCVPFFTVSTDLDTSNSQMVRCIKNVGTSKFDFTCGTALGARDLEVTIVEFDPAEVSIQEIIFTVPAGNPHNTDVTMTQVDLPSTMPIVYLSTVSGAENMSVTHYRVKWIDNTTFNVRLDTASTDLLGTAYIITALNNQFRIRSGNALIPSGFGSTTELINHQINVTPDRAAVWMYHDSGYDFDRMREGGWDAKITDANNLDITRSDGSFAPASTGDIDAWVVDFEPDVVTIQQGVFDYDTATTKTAAITAPAILGNAMIVGTKPHSWMEGDGTNNSKRGGLGRMSFNSATEVLGTRGVTGAGNYKQNFQVIEWIITLISSGTEPLIMHIG